MNACRMVLQVKYLSDLTHNAGTRLPFSTFDENNDTGKETTYSGQKKSRQTHMILMKKNNHNILQSRQLFISQIKHDTWAVEM